MTAEQAWAQVHLEFAAFVNNTLFGLGSRLAPINLLTMLAVMIALYFWRKPAKSFLTWAFPKEIYFSKSFGVDVKLFLFNNIIHIIKVLNFGVITALIATLMLGWLGNGQPEAATPNKLAIGLVLFMVSDGGYYFLHRMHHQVSLLWPLHSVHHSAEVMTPVTAYRVHPLYHILSTFYQSVLIGLAQGLLLSLFFNKVDFLMIAGVNSFYATFNLAASNLRHTHIWLSFGRTVEHIIISPAQHQIHHSTNPKHINKNYGEVLAIWDWIFGTLYVPDKMETLEFGISDKSGNRIQQPHPTFLRAIILPIQEIGAIVRQFFTSKTPDKIVKTTASRTKDVE